jgi:predicted molibdopterin-dependent oxidoreductase YjgC
MDIVPHTLTGDEDEVLIRADKTANSAGARLAGLVPKDEAHGIAGILEGVNSGRIKAVIVTDTRAAMYPGLMEALARARYVVAVVSNHSALTERADAVLAATTFAEKLGTLLNCDGQLQILRPALTTAENERWTGQFAMSRLDKFGTEFDRWGRATRYDARGTARILGNIAMVLGAKWKHEHPEDIFEHMASTIDALRGLDYERIGRWGVRIGGTPRAHLLPYVYTDVRA